MTAKDLANYTYMQIQEIYTLKDPSFFHLELILKIHED